MNHIAIIYLSHRNHIVMVAYEPVNTPLSPRNRSHFSRQLAQSSAHENFFQKKIHPRGKYSKHYTSRVLQIPFSSPESPIFGTKPLPCRRFLQHYYRDTFIESHRKPTEVPEISYCGHLINKSLFLFWCIRIYKR